MRMFICRATIACASFLLSVLSLPANALEDDCVKDHSQAWCLLDLAGYSKGARDITIDRANEIIAKAAINANPTNAQTGPDLGRIAVAGLDFAKLTHLPPGISPRFSGSMLLIGAFLDGPKAGERVQTFVILPEAEVKDGDPLATAEGAFVEAVLKYLEADGAEKVDEDRNPPLGSRYTIRAYKVSTGKCAAIPGGCWFTGSFFSCSNCRNRKPMVIDRSPNWVGIGRSYVWRDWFVQLREADSQGKLLVPHERLHKELCNYLPDSFYYFQPGELSLLVNGQTTRLLAK